MYRQIFKYNQEPTYSLMFDTYNKMIDIIIINVQIITSVL